MDLRICITIDDDAVDKIARVITETVRRVTEIQQGGNASQPATGGTVPTVSPAMPYSAQTAQATQMPVAVMTGQPAATAPVQTAAPHPAAPAQQTAILQPAAPTQQTTAPVQTAAPQPAAPVQQTAVPTAARTYTLDELAGAAMVLMDRGMQAQLQDLLAGFGVEALPMLPPEQYGNFATALRGMGAQI